MQHHRLKKSQLRSSKTNKVRAVNAQLQQQKAEKRRSQQLKRKLFSRPKIWRNAAQYSLTQQDGCLTPHSPLILASPPSTHMVERTLILLWAVSTMARLYSLTTSTPNVEITPLCISKYTNQHWKLELKRLKVTVFPIFHFSKTMQSSHRKN